MNFGIITYAGEAQVMYGFADFSNQLVLENALNTITITGSGRNIGRALNLARTNLFNQSSPGQNVHVHNVLIVVTDGGSDDPIAAPAYALREANVTIFTVAIGRYVHGQLKEMASDPDSDHMFTTEFYGGLGPLMADVKDAIIKGNYIKIPLMPTYKVNTVGDYCWQLQTVSEVFGTVFLCILFQ